MIDPESRYANLADGFRIKCATGWFPVKSMSEYTIWRGIKLRCLNPNDPAYPSYGGRGILMHTPWQDDFWAFLADVGLRPSKFHSLDRKEPNGNYEPTNVRWATALEQRHNRRREPNNKGENNPHSKLTYDIADEVRYLYSTTTVSQRSLANKFKTTQSNIHRIINNEIWVR